jgi:hypothetical protein
MEALMVTFAEAVAVCDEMYRARPAEESPEASVDAVIEKLISQAHYTGGDGDRLLQAVEAYGVLCALDVEEC